MKSVVCVKSMTAVSHGNLSQARHGNQETYLGQSILPLYLCAIRLLHGSTHWRKFLPNCIFHFIQQCLQNESTEPLVLTSNFSYEL